MRYVTGDYRGGRNVISNCCRTYVEPGVIGNLISNSTHKEAKPGSGSAFSFTGGTPSEVDDLQLTRLHCLRFAVVLLSWLIVGLGDGIDDEESCDNRAD